MLYFQAQSLYLRLGHWCNVGCDSAHRYVCEAAVVVDPCKGRKLKLLLLKFVMSNFLGSSIKLLCIHGRKELVERKNCVQGKGDGLG
jgi:hypothetical protein